MGKIQAEGEGYEEREEKKEAEEKFYNLFITRNEILF